MKKLLTLLFICMAMSVQATYILWVGVNENAVVHAGENTYSIPQFVSIVRQPMENMGGRILIDGIAMPAGYEDPPDQNPPAVSFDDDITEFELFLSEEIEPGVYVVSEPLTPSDWSPIKLGEESPEILDVDVIFEIGYWDGSENFIPLASSDSFPLNGMDDHYYEAGTIAPPTQTPWRPIDFYTDIPVPEPSITILAILGACAMLLKRG